MVQVPVVTNAIAPPEEIVQTPVVEEVKATVSPDVAVAVSVGVVPKFCAPGLAKVIVWEAFGVTAFEAEDDGPVRPAAFAAVTVKVYDVPFVSPVTVIGLDVPVPVRAPGLDVTM